MSTRHTFFQPFEMERMMSKWENVVEYNLSESGVYPLTLRELIQNGGVLDRLLDTAINYPQADGIIQLKEKIANMYQECSADNILVTVGSAEANYITLQTLLYPGDEIVIMVPNYMQVWGIAKNMSLRVRTFHLDEGSDWSLGTDIDEAVTDSTKLIAVCNPNNPTGHILTDREMEIIISAARRVGAWILADEVYAGSERLRDDVTPSFWSKYDKVIAVGSLSKAYGLPGLRIGWAVAPPATVDELWARHEYITISASMLSNHLASYALSSDVLPRIRQRARDYIRKGYPILKEWMDEHGGLFSVVPPHASAVAFVRYNLNINSTELVMRLIREKSVFIVPGDHFGMDHYLRISFGLEPDFLRAGLDRINDLLTSLKEKN